MPPTHRVAVVQWSIKNLAVEQNHATACDYIRSAAAQGAGLVVLPEYHLFGWAPEDPLFAVQASQTAQYLKAYQALAKELSICLVPGTIVEKHPHPDGDADPNSYVLYNTAYFISNTGEILGQYRKKNIWHPERAYLTSSTSEPHEVFDTPIGKVGLLICWDMAFPEAFRELIAAGAETIIIPTYCMYPPFIRELGFINIIEANDLIGGRYDASPVALKHNPNSEELFLDSTLTARCFENTCAVIFANYSGVEQSLGMSRVVLPIVGPVGKMENEEGVLVVDMDMDVVKIAEDNYKVRMDLGREEWYYSYRHSKKD